MTDIFNMDDAEVLVLQHNICINGKRKDAGELVFIRPDRVSYLEKIGFVVQRENITNAHIVQVEESKVRAEREAEFLKENRAD